MKRLLSLLTLAILVIQSTTAGPKDKYTDPYKGYEESAFMDMDLEQNIITPAVASGEHQAIIYEKYRPAACKQRLHRRHNA